MFGNVFLWSKRRQNPKRFDSVETRLDAETELNLTGPGGKLKSARGKRPKLEYLPSEEVKTCLFTKITFE